MTRLPQDCGGAPPHTYCHSRAAGATPWPHVHMHMYSAPVGTRSHTLLCTGACVLGTGEDGLPEGQQMYSTVLGLAEKSSCASAISPSRAAPASPSGFPTSVSPPAVPAPVRSLCSTSRGWGVVEAHPQRTAPELMRAEGIASYVFFSHRGGDWAGQPRAVHAVRR